MNRRYLWPLAGLLAVLVLTVSHVNDTTAQKATLPFVGGGQVGRFVVAHASDKQIVILDTTSGKLYRATEKDFLKYSDLPKQEPMKIPLPFLDKGKKDGFEGRGKDRGDDETFEKARKEYANALKALEDAEVELKVAVERLEKAKKVAADTKDDDARKRAEEEVAVGEKRAKAAADELADRRKKFEEAKKALDAFKQKADKGVGEKRKEQEIARVKAKEAVEKASKARDEARTAHKKAEDALRKAKKDAEDAKGDEGRKAAEEAVRKADSAVKDTQEWLRQREEALDAAQKRLDELSR